jgi:mannose-6-phosphate isomerase
MRDAYYPLTFRPVLKDYIWGGRGLERLGRKLPPGNTAESWEIAAHPNGTTIVDNGRFAGTPLDDLHAGLGLELVGRNAHWSLERGKFPLLIKLLDADRPLSVQVHPDDDYALANEGNELGKSEMWVVLHAKPGAELVLGVKEGTTRETFKRAIEDGQLELYLHTLPVKAGDHVCVPAGSLHAIMGGLLIAEIQQNSDTTYRVYDWNRTGSDGQPRPLHVNRALDVVNFEQIEPELPEPVLIADEAGIRRALLCRNRYFSTERVTMQAGASYRGDCDGDSLEIWGVLEGQIRIQDLAVTAVRFILLPAVLGPFTIEAQTRTTLLRTTID